MDPQSRKEYQSIQKELDDLRREREKKIYELRDHYKEKIDVLVERQEKLAQQSHKNIKRDVLQMLHDDLMDFKPKQWVIENTRIIYRYHHKGANVSMRLEIKVLEQGKKWTLMPYAYTNYGHKHFQSNRLKDAPSEVKTREDAMIWAQHIVLTHVKKLLQKTK